MHTQDHHPLYASFNPIKKTFVSIALLLLAHSSAYSQNEVVTPLGLKATMPSSSYQLSDIDSVNLFNGRVTVRIPILTACPVDNRGCIEVGVGNRRRVGKLIRPTMSGEIKFGQPVSAWSLPWVIPLMVLIRRPTPFIRSALVRVD